MKYTKMSSKVPFPVSVLFLSYQMLHSKQMIASWPVANKISSPVEYFAKLVAFHHNRWKKLVMQFSSSHGFSVLELFFVFILFMRGIFIDLFLQVAAGKNTTNSRCQKRVYCLKDCIVLTDTLIQHTPAIYTRKFYHQITLVRYGNEIKTCPWN